LTSGTAHQMHAETDNVGLSMYMPIWKNMLFSDLLTKLKYDLHTVEFTLEGVTEDESGTDKPSERGTCNYNSIGGVNLCDYNLWCDGVYNAQGIIEAKEGRFSTKDCYQVEPSGIYMLTMKDTRFKVMVYEYADDGSLIATTELSSGDTHTMKANTCHIGLSMYMPIWKDLPYSELVTKLKYDLHTVLFTIA